MKIEDGYTTQFIKAYVIQAEIPFLMGTDTLKEWGAVIEMSGREINFTTIGIVVKQDKEGGDQPQEMQEVSGDYQPRDLVMVPTMQVFSGLADLRGEQH